MSNWTIAGVAPILVGNSLGGVLALRAAEAGGAGGADVAGVVPVSPAGFGHAWWINLMQSFAWLIPLLLWPIVPMSAYRWCAERAFGFLAAGGRPMLGGHAATYAAQYREISDVRRMLAPAPQVLTEIRAWSAMGTPIDIPALVLWGRRDRLTRVAGATRLQALLSRGTVELLDGCGHCPQLQQPAFVARHVGDFHDLTWELQQAADPA